MSYKHRVGFRMVFFAELGAMTPLMGQIMGGFNRVKI